VTSAYADITRTLQASPKTWLVTGVAGLDNFSTGKQRSRWCSMRQLLMYDGKMI
jgi:hypothetical protein